MNSTWCVLVQKKEGEKLRQWLITKSLLDRNLKIESDNEWLIFPIIRELDASEHSILLNLLENVRFERRKMQNRDLKKPGDLFSAIKQSIPEKLHSYIPKSFDIIGKLVILEIPEELEKFQNFIGQTLLNLHPSLSSVFKKLEPIKGEYRLRHHELIAGEDNSITIHKENNCMYELDIQKVYFSPRLATEHVRVNSQVDKDELILDMFTGIGPFSILIAKEKQAHVFAVDINPDAIYYLKRNIISNKVEGYVTPLEDNVKEAFKNKNNRRFDRIIMNLPSKSAEFLDTACKVLKEGGVIHFYQFAPESDIPGQVTKKIQYFIEREGRKIEEIKELRKVRPYAPHIWQIGVDILIN